MKVYLASRYSDHPTMRLYRDQLWLWGHEVTSRWIEGNHEVLADEQGLTDEHQRHIFFASEDYEDLLAADCSIHFTEDWQNPRPGRNRGGRHVEFGIALELRRRGLSGIEMRRGLEWYRPVPHRIIVVGHRENVFHWLPQVEFYATWGACISALTVKEAVS